MSKQNPQQALSPEKYIRTRARSLPIGTCYINANWRESGLAIIFVTRRHINGHITHAAYMVDIYCLGLKESFWTFNEDPLDFKDFMEKQREMHPQGIPLKKIDYTLVHNIIYGAIEYAGELGLLPHKSFDITRYILEEDDDRVEFIDLPFGYKGKPLYISSPGRPAERNRVLAQLEKNPGKGNYEFITEADVPEFFDKEEEKEREKANYHDPEVKRGIITDFIAHAEAPAEPLFKEADKLREMIELTDTVFYEYMVTDAELAKALEIIEGLFDFRISDELFSDEMLSGKSLVPTDTQEIRMQAERVHSLSTDGHIADGIRLSREMMDKYPGYPVFIYLYMRLLEEKDGLRGLNAKLEKYLVQYPEYLPLAQLNTISILESKPGDISMQIVDSLHLKNFYPHRKTFSREEVLLYLDMLLPNYHRLGEFTLIEVLISFIEDHYPGLMPESSIITEKLHRIPFVFTWCKRWMENATEGLV